MSDRVMTGAVGYGAAHWRIRKLRGRAPNYPCVDCSAQAEEWSYVGPPEYAYSSDPGHYQPRCRRCHRKLDIGTSQEGNAFRRRGEKHPHAKLTATDVLEIRAAVASGESQRSVAKRYGTTQWYVWSIKEGSARQYD